MSLETLFWTQIGSIITFIVTLFILYRLLVEQKDATIQMLKENISILKDQLSDARANSPDALARALHDRTKILEEELKRLSSDRGSSLKAIKRKEGELESFKQQLEELKSQVKMAKLLLTDIICPKFGAPMSRRDYASESVEYHGSDYDVDHEYSEYECGFSMVDGEERSPCRKAK